MIPTAPSRTSTSHSARSKNAAAIRLGAAYARKGDNDRAIRNYDEAIQLDPKMFRLRWPRRIYAGFAGNHERAIQDYNRAIEIDPKIPRLR